jgi:hypothetical protein
VGTLSISGNWDRRLNRRTFIGLGGKSAGRMDRLTWATCPRPLDGEIDEETRTAMRLAEDYAVGHRQDRR